ncbi:Bifunctional hemolysin/adenylate cyclase [Aliiroseovarius pelagivivens]|uniref:Bifunctional hemolysin/adenylate cyclase n=1 Tax=Aliiroseovarius pelagivivens TaxID=1639690 RepID=A0A2R8ASD0_9RHOB|nr:calcium-binding protein [Aliiroseovarius pelagivivens]SPF78968.1 Bifunctional hemolysin/adenylate cyclase [Aliiroseovarius pelagivivens]
MAKIIGTNANETIIGTQAKDILKGKGGNDTIRGLGGNDRIFGGEGADLMIGGAGNDFIDAGPTNTGFNVAKGGGGNDTIYSSGTGEYYGGSGNDYIKAGFGVNELLDGGSGVDWLDTSLVSLSYTVNMVTGATNWAGESFVNFENILTGDGNDNITGTSGKNIIMTGAGTDTINAGAGNDILDGGRDADILNGGSGTDTADYSNSTSSITVVIDTNKVWDGTGTDTISSIEKFKGSDYTDYFYSDFGDHYTFLGRAGDDYFYKTEGTGPNNKHTFNGGSGTDTFHGQGLSSFHTINLTKGYVYADTTERDKLISIENVVAYNGSTVIGSHGDNVLSGAGNYSYTLKGNKGNDTINGNSLGDVLFGGAGKDTIRGNGGNDTINGDQGNDKMWGGSGSDTFVFKGQFGKDRINDFNAFDSDEKIDFSGVSGITGYNDLMNNHATQVGTNVVIKVGSNKVTLVDVSLNDLDTTDFLF